MFYGRFMVKLLYANVDFYSSCDNSFLVLFMQQILTSSLALKVGHVLSYVMCEVSFRHVGLWLHSIRVKHCERGFDKCAVIYNELFLTCTRTVFVECMLVTGL